MDFDKTIKQFHGIACVIAYKKGTDGQKDSITLEAANEAYLASVGKQNEIFEPGRPYTYYIQRDANFEATVRTCVASKKIQHMYVNAGLYNGWLDLFLLPAESDVPGTDYCIFTYEITEDVKTEKLLDVSQNIALEVLRTCIKLRKYQDFQTAMDAVIADIRKMCDSSGCSILLTDFENRKCKILCADHDGSFTQDRDDIVFMEDFFSVAETWRDLMAGSNCYIIADENDMREAEKRDKVWTDSMKISGVRNVVLFPLKVKQEIIGYIWATNFNAEKTQFIREVMELTGFFLSAEIASHQLFEKLEMLSKYDMLTGTLSRNSMNTRMDEWTSGKNREEGNYGIVFVDVNGLKTINDVEGHAAGDVSIRRVADRIKVHFGKNEIYRAGGDEFMILVTGCSKEEFERRVDELKSHEEDDETARFAVGSYYDDSGYNINRAVQLADQSMYADKSEYYKRHPELNRRTC